MSVTKKSIQKVLVSGKGDKKVSAFSSALNEVSKKVLKESSEVLLRIEPKAVTVISAEEQLFTERFLFFFFPRKRTVYNVQLEVEVEIQSIGMEQVVFEKSEQGVSEGIAIPFLSKRI